eukprot:scaffold1552_cov197-Ochromonas_danica.AAC.2
MSQFELTKKEKDLRRCHLVTNDKVTILLADGSLYTCGQDEDADLENIRPGLSFADPPKLLSAPDLPPDIIAVSTGGYHTLFLTASNQIYGMGSNQFGQLGFYPDPQHFMVDSPIELVVPAEYRDRRIRSVHALLHGGSIALLEDGSILSCGEMNCRPGEQGPGLLPINLSYFEGQKVVDIQMGGIVHFVTEEGALFVAGYDWDGNYKGKLGFLPEEFAMRECDTPKRLDCLWNRGIRVAKSSSGYASSMIIDQDGLLHGWGCNRNGQLGLPIDEANPFIIGPHAIPVLKANGEPERFKQISCSWGHALALSVDGVPYSFGHADLYGRLGRDTLEGSNVSPVNVSGRKIAHVCAGQQVSLFLCAPGDGDGDAESESLLGRGILPSLDNSYVGSCGLGGRGSLIGGTREILHISFVNGLGHNIKHVREGRREVVFFTMAEAIAGRGPLTGEGPPPKRRRLVYDDEELEGGDSEEEDGAENKDEDEEDDLDLYITLKYSDNPQYMSAEPADSFKDILERVQQDSDFIQSLNEEENVRRPIVLVLASHYGLADLSSLLHVLSDAETIAVLGKRLSGLALWECCLFCRETSDLVALADVLGSHYPLFRTFSLGSSCSLFQDAEKANSGRHGSSEESLGVLCESLVRSIGGLESVYFECLGEESFSRFMRALIDCRPQHLKAIHIESAKVQKNVQLISDVLELNLPSLRTLRLPDLSHLNNKTFTVLCGGLKKNTHLETLDLHLSSSERRAQKIANNGVKSLVEILEKNSESALCALDISGEEGPDISVNLRKRLKRQLINHAKQRNRKLLKYARLEIWQNHENSL